MKNYTITLFLLSIMIYSCDDSPKQQEPQTEKPKKVNNDTGLIKLAKEAGMKRKMDTAVMYLEEALIREDYQKIKDEVYNLMSLTHALNNKYPLAAKYLDSAIAISPANGQLHFHKFLLYRRDSTLINDPCADLLKAKELGVKDEYLEESLAELQCN